jgi:DNA processing protein
MEEERLLTIGLNTLPGLRAAAYHDAIARFGTVAGLLAAPPGALAGIRGCGPETSAALRRLDAARAGEAEARRAAALGVEILTLADAGYPAALRSIADPPPVLYCRGGLLPGDGDAIAIVGSRKATPYGRTVAERLGRDLAACGIAVVSGLARGIDGCAHRAALAAGGRTIAVLGAGLDRIYPPEHRGLAGEVAGCGALLTEFPLGLAPDKWHFPLRNRVISGLARGVVVVEAGERSGALITVDQALEQAREVFAVPGPVTSPASAGTNRLIKQGAKLVEDVRDILEEFPGFAARLPAAAPAGADAISAAERRLLAGLGSDPRSIDEITRTAAVAAAETSALLTGLEVKGLVRQFAGKLFARA